MTGSSQWRKIGRDGEFKQIKWKFWLTTHTNIRLGTQM